MSNFYCEHCGKAICDSNRGYITGCEHYPITEFGVPNSNRESKEKELAMERERLNAILDGMVAENQKYSLY
jgi:hypothetical protein